MGCNFTPKHHVRRDLVFYHLPLSESICPSQCLNQGTEFSWNSIWTCDSRSHNFTPCTS